MSESAPNVLSRPRSSTLGRRTFADLLSDSPTIEIRPGAARPRAVFGEAAFVVIEDGFVVIRATLPDAERSVVTGEGGPGTILLPPSAHETLSALSRSLVTVVTAEVRDQWTAVPRTAQQLVEQLAAAVKQRQESLANFAPTRRTERVRRKLLQLARSYGHVIPGGIRIDFPLSHALLAEMVGSSRETVTRALDELRREGFVVRAGSTYRLLISPEAMFAAS